MKRYRRLFILFTIVLTMALFNPLALAHPGRTDSKGGHYNRATGEYHYHNGGSTSSGSSYTKPTYIPPPPPPPQPINVYVNGNELYLDQDPVVSGGRVLVPLRPIMEALGANVNWDSISETVNATRQSTTLKLQVGKQFAYCNGAQVNLDEPSKIIGGRVFVPLRFISETFGASVGWDNNSRMVTVNY